MTNQLQEWNEDEILSLIANKAEESFTLEFKACDALTNDKWKGEFAKDVSAFANSAGGTIIYGIRENKSTHEADSIDLGYEPSKISKERLEQVINSNIHRRIEGVRYHVVRLNQTCPGKVLYVIQVPESANAPHMANHRFYKRVEFASVPMEENEVRASYRRETYPSKDIIRAWFDDAINPLIRELAAEEEGLREERWTWNHFNKSFGGLSAKSEPLNPSANLEDFLSRHSVIKDGLLEHDRGLVALNDEGASFFEKFAGSSCLREVFAHTTSEDSLRVLKAEHPHKFTGNTTEEIFSQVISISGTEQNRFDWLAAYSINQTQRIQNDSLMPFWEKHRESFFQLLMWPPMSEYRARVVDARESLSKINQNLIVSLKEIRKELSEQHGVPFQESQRPLIPYTWGLGGYT